MDGRMGRTAPGARSFPGRQRGTGGTRAGKSALQRARGRADRGADTKWLHGPGRVGLPLIAPIYRALHRKAWTAVGGRCRGESRVRAPRPRGAGATQGGGLHRSCAAASLNHRC
ncbi:hypothetical protein CERSUDRAFT_111540, partial [Gelatoporia subvermispora B]